MAKKSIKDITAQAQRLQSLNLRMGFGRNNYSNDTMIRRGNLINSIGGRYIANLIKAQTKGFTEEELNSGRGASFTRKMGRGARMGTTTG